MVLLVNMHLIKGTLLFSHVTWLGTGQFQWSIGTNGPHVVWLGTGQFQSSIGTNGTIGTNVKAPYSNGSIGAKQVRFYTK